MIQINNKGINTTKFDFIAFIKASVKAGTPTI